MIEKVSCNGIALRNAAEVLQYAAKELRAGREEVPAAVPQDVDALELAAMKLRAARRWCWR